jgi:hypothetical protein
MKKVITTIALLYAVHTQAQSYPNDSIHAYGDAKDDTVYIFQFDSKVFYTQSFVRLKPSQVQELMKTKKIKIVKK